mgnify:FL=1
MLVDNEGSKPSVLRASQDVYLQDTNFSDLPDVPSGSKEESASRTYLTNLSKLIEMSKTMHYDEQVQS